MKKCPACGMQYQDTEKYCMECGKKLIKMELAEMPPSELMSLVSHVNDLEREVRSMRENSSPQADPTMVAGNTKDMQRLRAELDAFRRMTANMPPEDLISLVAQVGELGSAIDDISKSISAFRKTKIPEEILDIGKHSGELRKLRNDINVLRATIRKDVANVAVSVLKGTRSEIFQEVQKFKNVISTMEERTSAEIEAIREEVDAFVSAQAGRGKPVERAVIEGLLKEMRILKGAQDKIEANGVQSSEITSLLSHVKGLGDEVAKLKNNSVPPAEVMKISGNAETVQRMKAEFNSARKELNSLRKAQEKMELDRVMPDESIEKKIDDMLGKRMDDVKVNVTRDIVSEIRKTLER